MKYATLFLLAIVLAGKTAAQNVGIGTTTPTATLDVAGAIRIRGGAPAAGKVLTTDASGNASWTPSIKPGVVMTDNAADPDLLANNYSNISTVLLATKNAVTGPATSASWTRATNFFGARLAPAVISAGTNEFIVFGGNADNSNLTSGAIYNSVADTWIQIPDIGDGVERSGPMVVWAGTKLVVWGGYKYNGSFTYHNSGAVYDPATKTWTTMSVSGAPSGRVSYLYAYNPATNEIAIWGGVGAGAPFADGARYNVGTNTWTAISTANAPTARYGMAFATNGTGQILLFGGYTTTYSAQAFSYNFASNTWASFTAPSLSARYGSQMAFVNGRFVIWGGSSANSSSESDGAIYTVANNTWTAMGTAGVPNGYGGKTAVSNNYFVVVGFNGCAKFDPALNSWSSLELESRANHGLAGNSNSLFTYGGTTSLVNGSPQLETGSRFFWTAQSITSHVNSAMELYLYRKN